MPSTPEAIKATFGVGWWKYDLGEATKLLESVGFKKGADGKWLQPDGTAWKISMDAPSDFEVESRRVALATARSWRKFGVDVDVNLMQSAAFGNHYHSGQFTVASQWWPLSCAVISDLYSNLGEFHKDYVAAPGSPSPNNPERFSTPEISALIDQLRKLPSDDPSIVPTWTKVLQDVTEQTAIINIVGHNEIRAHQRQVLDQLPQQVQLLRRALVVVVRVQRDAAEDQAGQGLAESRRGAASSRDRAGGRGWRVGRALSRRSSRPSRPSRDLAPSNYLEVGCQTRIIQFGTSRFLQAHVDLFVHEARVAGQPIGPITVVKTTSDADRSGAFWL